jgi:pimeloyl-ACP methyl ester carboxylesterase
MYSSFISYKNSSIHYTTCGQGQKLLLCFHGFGETAESFAVFEKLLAQSYTIIAIDLPFHGQTSWNEQLLFTVEDLLAIIDSIPFMNKRNFSIMGFSMGGRVCLQLYQHVAERIEKLILIAPDGLKVNVWYRVATQTGWGNQLLKSAMKKPFGFFAFTRLLKKASLVNMGVYNYIHIHLKNENMRMRLYTIWTTMRKMKPSIPVIQSLIQQYHTPVVLIYGEHDKVIRFTTGEKFKKKIEPFCSLHILPTGHRLLHEKNSAAIAALI